MVDLDVPSTYERGDPSRMIDQIREMDRQVQDAWRIVQHADLPASFRDCQAVVVLGMGGSAIGGDLVRVLGARNASVPILVSREYDLPGFVGPNSLVIASSYSGSTEETLSATEEALTRKARVVAVTTDGRPATMGEERGFPVVRFHYPAQPRSALGYSLVLILGMLVKLGYLPERVMPLDDMVHVVRDQVARLDTGVPISQNPAKQLARALLGRIPVVYGGGVTAEVARRWKGQFNENSKTWAFFEQFPELDHNAIMGYEFPKGMAQKIMVLMLRSDLSHPRVNLRYDITGEILQKRGVEYRVIQAVGNSELSHVASLVVYGDYVSYYLAILAGTDPTSIEAINYLKGRLTTTGAI